MNRRQLIRDLIDCQEVPRCGFWLGMPHAETWPKLHHYFGTSGEKELRTRLGDDVAWICPQFYADVYKDPSGRELFDAGLDRVKHGSVGPLAEARTVREIEVFPWPDPDYLDFTSCLRDLEQAGDVYRLSGFWTCYWHNACDLFGMEDYLMKMLTAPELVQAATNRICRFYEEANERFFTAAKGMVDGFFFGNDLGSQRGLIISPAQFDEFIFPWMERFAQQGKRHGLQIVVHSCGSIEPLINRFIDAGVQCLHPLQAKAKGMDAENLAHRFKGRIAFLGGDRYAGPDDQREARADCRGSCTRSGVARTECDPQSQSRGTAPERAARKRCGAGSGSRDRSRLLSSFRSEVWQALAGVEGPSFKRLCSHPTCAHLYIDAQFA